MLPFFDKPLPTLFARDDAPAVLVIAPAWIGDALMAQSLFKVLKRQQAHLNIDVLAPAWSAGLLKRMPEVRHIFTHTIEHGQLAWQERYRLGKSLRRYRYQQAIVLPNSWKSALIPFWARIPQRTGYIGEMRYGLLNDRRPLDTIALRQTVEQFAALGLPKNDPRIGKWVPQPRLLAGNVELTLQRLQLTYSQQQPVLALCPGAEYGPAKRWPLEYFATVAQRQGAQGWQVWLLGSAKDTELGARIQALAGTSTVNLCGRTQLPEVIDLLSVARVVVSNDSGLMHVAAALDKPLLALYGSSDPEMTPPLSQRAQILYLGLPCSPCFERFCPLKHLNCLRELSPDRVLAELRALNLQ